MSDRSKFRKRSTKNGKINPEHRDILRLNIKAARMFKDVSQNDLANKFRVTQQTVSQYESKGSDKTPCVWYIHCVAEILNIKPYTLLIPCYYYQNIEPDVLDKVGPKGISPRVAKAIEKSIKSSRSLYGG